MMINQSPFVSFCYLHYNTVCDYLIICYIILVSWGYSRPFHFLEMNQRFLVKSLVSLAPTSFVANAKKERMSEAWSTALAILVFCPCRFKRKTRVLEKSVLTMAGLQKGKQAKKRYFVSAYWIYLSFLLLPHIGEFQWQTAILDQRSKCLDLKSSFLSSAAVCTAILWKCILFYLLLYSFLSLFLLSSLQNCFFCYFFFSLKNDPRLQKAAGQRERILFFDSDNFDSTLFLWKSRASTQIFHRWLLILNS